YRPSGIWSLALPSCVRVPCRPRAGPPFLVGPTGQTTCSTCMVVGAGGQAVHADLPDHLPDHLARHIGSGLCVRQDAVPGAVAPPAMEPVGARLPGVVVFGQVAPGCSRVQQEAGSSMWLSSGLPTPKMAAPH